MTSSDDELESYLAALAPDDTETTGSGQRLGAPQVYQLRLPPLAGEELHELAAHHDVSPGALLQEWVLQRLSWETQQLPR